MSRPNRSDAHLLPEEEAKIEEEAREYFEGVAPRRHTKPQRSEYSNHYSDALQPSDGDGIPELDKFRDLEANPQKLVYDAGEAPDEYVETEYYKDLNCVDKQHHTTGSGFIKVETDNGCCFNLTSDSDSSDCYGSCKGNPATNEWVPSAVAVIPDSNKPKRSDI